MSFTQSSFLSFFVLFVLGFALLRGRARAVWLLLGSWLFYASWDARFVVLIVASTAVDYLVARLLDRSDDEVRRRRLLGISVAFNLGALGFFKYAGFFVASAVELALALGFNVSRPTLEIVLPVGISFYTFQTLGYTIDVYRRQVKASRDPLDFAIYVAFFPQLVAGPIERAGSLLKEVARVSRERWQPRLSGLGLIGLGLFKKAVLADGVRHYVRAYDAPADAYGAAVWFATYAFAFQIYWDFSGYSDMAVGTARLLGIELSQNFRAPWAATGPSDFWRRWHVTLSSWLRDYLYIPLGGNRCGEVRRLRNLGVTMVLGGLWHGAAWHFALWGAFHGVLLAGERGLVRLGWLGAGGSGSEGRLRRALRCVVFFHVGCLGWALFRAPTLERCLAVWRKLLLFDGLELTAFVRHLAELRELVPAVLWLSAFAVGFTLHVVYPKTPAALIDRLWAAPLLPRAACVGALFYLALLLSPMKPPAFIYFQF